MKPGDRTAPCHVEAQGPLLEGEVEDLADDDPRKVFFHELG